MSGDFDPEQKRYLEGFVTGLQIAKATRGAGAPQARPPARPSRAAPMREHRRAQDRVLAAGGKLSEQEKFKRELNPFDAYERLKAQAANNEYPKPADNFRWRFLRPVLRRARRRTPICAGCGCRTASSSTGNSPASPTSPSAMAAATRMSPPAPICRSARSRPKNAVAMVEAIQDLGLCSRGSGADNIRNVTGTPTAGIDPQELIDTRPYAREWHFHILNERALYGLPRKFNVAFDGGGVIPVLEDTNDIGFQAVEVKDGFGVEPGVWFRLMLGGITGHKDFARDTGVVVRPADATKVADAIVRVYIDHGDRTDRNKARLKYVIDRMGIDEGRRAGRREARPQARPRARRKRWRRARPFDRAAHIGVHRAEAGRLALDRRGAAGRQADRRADARPRRGRAAISATAISASRSGRTCCISGVPTDKVAARRRRRSRRSACPPAPPRSAPAWSPAPAMSAASFAASDTKRHAEEIARWCEARVELDGPVNIHLTGCHHSCAQHYIGDIGLLACKVPTSDDGDTVEGYHIQVGGGFGPDAAIAPRDLPRREGRGCAAHGRAHAQGLSGAPRFAARRRFLAFTRRHDIDALQRDGRARGGRMSSSPRAAVPSLIPENAPFTAEQRVWLNGFFAGLLRSTTASRRCRPSSASCRR